MSDIDDLVTALIKGDPDELISTEIVTAMAQAALAAGWRPAMVYGVPHGVKYQPASRCPHDNHLPGHCAEPEGTNG